LEKGTNAPVFANAELIVSSAEYMWWTDPARVGLLPEGRRGAGKRIADVFPTWKNWRLVEDGAEVAPGLHMALAPGHTPGHAVSILASGAQTLLISDDTMYVPALLAPHPDWQGSYDQDGPMAIDTRRKLIDRAIADKMMICGSHFPFPGTGTFVKAGNAYEFTPSFQS
jgi:glyoxylase-like metal-dependent hydrolase (beta-lactamase superfamily II)